MSWQLIGNITGPQGNQGATGKSAYQSAVESGYSGTESQWLASLIGGVGPAGPSGPSGPKGDTGDAGHSPVLTWSGDKIAIDGVASGPSLTGPQGPAGLNGTGSGDMLAATYDTNGDGKVNAADSADVAPWSGITGKPSTFAPDAHNHTIGDVTGLQTALDGKQAAGSYATATHNHDATYAALSHAHAIGEVTGLQTALDGKAASGHNHDGTYEPAITAGTSAQYIRGDKTLATMPTSLPASDVSAWAKEATKPTYTKSEVGLGNVDNTSDANKPVSTAQATAIGLKQDTLVSGTSIKTVNSTSLLGSGNIVTGDVTLTGTQTLTNKTFTGYTETEFNTATALSVANGTVQYKTLTANTTFTNSLSNGQGITLMLNPSTYNPTWPTTTWIGTTASTAPNMVASVYNCIIFFQMQGVLYGRYVGRV
jgi:hypothetical protein